MSDVLTAERIAAIKERCDKASPPADASGWEIGWVREEVIGGNRYVFAATGPFVAEEDTTPPVQTKHDALFIAAARADIPALIASHAALTARLRAAEEREQELRDALAEIRDDPANGEWIARGALAASSQRAGDGGDSE